MRQLPQKLKGFCFVLTGIFLLLIEKYNYSFCSQNNMFYLVEYNSKQRK